MNESQNDKYKEYIVSIKIKQPKYRIGEEIWIMDDNRVEKLIITGVHYDREGVFSYCFDGYKEAWIEEESLFPSKEELITSL